MPSALSVSKAYSISLRLPCASGGAMTANRPKRPGWSRTILAPYSLSWRARPRASSTLFPYQTPGWAIERIAVAMPLLSISSSEAAGDHFGGGAPARRPGAIMASTPCAFAGAVRPITGIAPAPSAATPPAKNFRRAGFARDGWQHRQVRKNLIAELALIPSSRFCCGVSLALVPAVFQAPTPRIGRSPGAPVICSVAIATFADARLAGGADNRSAGATPPRQRIAAIRWVGDARSF